MKKNLLIALAAFMVVPATNYAQNEVDALRYSWQHMGGTARYMGMAGAFGAVGADLSTLSINPAGIAKYSKSEATFTPGFLVNDVDASYNGSVLNGSKYSLTINNAGLVGVYNFTEDDFTMWKSIQFGIAYNRTGNFHSDIIIQGENTDNSLLDVFEAESEGAMPEQLDPFGAYLAWESWATSPYDTIDYNYYHELQGQPVTQTKTIFTRGSMGETALTLGGNYNNKLLIGFTVGFPNVKYSEQTSHQEKVLSDSTATLTEFSYYQTLETSGVGINAKFGMIFMPVDWIRVGAAIHSPTRLALTDQWSTSMSTEFKDGRSYDVSSPFGEYDYAITTPAKVVGSAAFIIAGQGMISVDYEFVDYSQAKLKSARTAAEFAYSFAEENLAVNENYTAAGNIRAGAEWRLPPFTVRGGYALYQSPFRDGIVGNDAAKTTYSVGAGYRNNGFFMDVAYALTKWKEDYYLYDPVLVNTTQLDQKLTQFLVTVGFRY